MQSVIESRTNPATRESRPVVNDVHSALNATRVARVDMPMNFAALASLVRQSAKTRQPFALCGARHAMGGQNALRDAQLLDMRRLDRVLAFDRVRGLIEVEAGIQWPALLDYLYRAQPEGEPAWAFTQKQTGADALTLGGSLAANMHGRGLAMKPFVQDIEAFTIFDARGELKRCSRGENAELFALAIGGYGLFGAVYSVTLRLTPRRKLERVVELIDIDDVMSRLASRIDAGYLYGDFQFAIEATSDAFMRAGVLSCYRPVDDATAIGAPPRALSECDWRELLVLAHTDKARAFERYAAFYLSTHGQRYWSDAHQMSVYVDGYHREVDRALGVPGSEMISEIYVPREALTRFFDAVREDFRRNRVDLIYGTVRLIERDDETFLPWAREPYACVIFNLHVEHTIRGLARAQDAFRRLIDHGIRFEGSYYLTYHRWATREQVLACHARLPSFLRRKRELDPHEVFRSDWYDHTRALLA